MTNAELARRCACSFMEAESAKGRENRRRGTLPAAAVGVVWRAVYEAQR